MLHCWQFRFFHACFKRISMTHPDYCPSPCKDASYWRQWWRARKEISHKASACFLSSTSWGDHHLAHKTLSISTRNTVYGYSWLKRKPNPTTGFAKQEWTVIESIMPPRSTQLGTPISPTHKLSILTKIHRFCSPQKMWDHPCPDFFVLENRSNSRWL